MFTGLVERIGIVKRVHHGVGTVIEIAFAKWERRLEEGESVAVNGVCLTVVKADDTHFTANVLRETEERSGIGDLIPGDCVNLERAVRAGQPLGGHIVQGHVDCRGEVIAREPRGRDFRLKVKCGRVLAAQSIVKGSIAIDGVSLTITAKGDDWLAVDLIPTSASNTTLGRKKQGDKVNLEGDVIGKYVAGNATRMASENEGTLTEEALARAGFLD